MLRLLLPILCILSIIVNLFRGECRPWPALRGRTGFFTPPVASVALATGGRDIFLNIFSLFSRISCVS